MEFGIMKYMGSKRWMLGNGLGTILTERARDADRFVDLFAGTGAVSWHVAERVDRPVLAVDLQTYSAVLAGAVIGRTSVLDANDLGERWIGSALELRQSMPLWGRASLAQKHSIDPQTVQLARNLCGQSRDAITSSYGGYYFSPSQAITIDALLRTLP